MSSKYFTRSVKWKAIFNTYVMNPIIIGTPIATTKNTEVEMEEQKKLVTLNIKNLNEAYVIVKRYNGGVYFKRTQYVTDVKSYPNKDCLYYSKQEADDKVVALNSTRNKCKYSVENAGKYFINLFTAHFNRWGVNEVTVSNEAISIKDFEANKYNKSRFYKTIEEATDSVKSSVVNEVSSCVVRAKGFLDNLPKEIEELTNRRNKEHQDYMKTANDLNEIVIKLSTVTNQSVKDYETQGDRIARVLYAKNETTTKSNSTLTTGDAGKG